MNAFRVIGIVLLSVILLTTLVSLGTTETLQKSTKYENIRYNFITISEDFLEENGNLNSMIEQSLPLMQTYCTATNETSYTFQQNQFTFNLSCDTINQGTDAIINQIINDIVGTFIEETYYQEYDCGMIQCLQQQQPMVLISEKAHEYWTQKSNLFLLISLGLAVALFFLTKHKSNFFLISGGLVIGASVVVSQLPSIVSNITTAAMGPATSPLQQMGVPSDVFARIASSFFSQAGDVYLWLLITGILLVVIGVLFKVFGLAGKIAGLFKGKHKNPKKEKGSGKKPEKKKSK